jgi:hypothetical protein
MASHHDMVIEVEISFVPPGYEESEREYVYPKIEILYSMIEGAPDTWDEPGWGDEFELLKAVLLDGYGVQLDDSQVWNLAEEWFNNNYELVHRNAHY